MKLTDHLAALCGLALCSFATGQSATWTQSPINGHFYALTPPSNWEQAELWAVANGAHLVTIRSDAEQQWLQQTYSAPLNADLWIGLNDIAQAGEWRWVSGEPLTYTSWAGGEPNYFGVERRVEMQPPGGNWNNQSNWTRQGIAERRPPGSFSTFGAGCPSPTGQVPQLAERPGETPAIGSSATIQVSNLPPTVTVTLFIIGLSTVTSIGPNGLYPLPQDLAPLGWHGCTQWVSIDDTIYTITASGVAETSVYLPPLTILVGLQYHVQALTLYHPTGIAISNALTATVGY